MTTAAQPTPRPVPGPAAGGPIARPPAEPHARTIGSDPVAAQKGRYGGIKWGSAFFGWLTATGTGLLLTTVAAAAGVATGLTRTPAGAAGVVGEAAQAAENPATASTLGLAGGLVLLVVLFVSYYCGGYVAGRMARFHGARQGVAVWLWAVLAAVVVAMLGVLAGAWFEVLAAVGGLPPLPIHEGLRTTGGIVAAGGIMAAVVALVASLAGAVLGGLAGMRFHRRVDRAAATRDAGK
jgi:hypothetical protein